MGPLHADLLVQTEPLGNILRLGASLEDNSQSSCIFHGTASTLTLVCKIG